MKRKTNIFYDHGEDSNFLTFSNYTEALTGNFISTNTKLFPSKFLCIFSPKLKEETDNGKFDLIRNYLAGGYENKLAFLRDKIIEKNEGEYKNTYTIESEIASLSYLLEYLQKFDEQIEIRYIGDISEQDFNGTYTDTICFVDSMFYKSVKENDEGFRWPIKNIDEKEIFNYIEILNSDGDVLVSADENPLSDYLYGWFYLDKANEVQKKFENDDLDIKPLFDGENKEYNKISVYKNLEIEDILSPGNADDEDKKQIKELEFNIIIPLFDLININYKNDIVTLQETDTINLLADGKKDDNGVYNAPYISNVPLGIWFSPTFSTVLKRDYDKKFAQSWSLVIGSQFKPFPYMSIIPNEIQRDGIAGAYMTFAEALNNQTNITDKINTLLKTINELISKVNKIESTINNCPGLNDNNMNNLRQDFLDYKNEVNNIINNFQQQLNNTDLRWVNREG